MGSRRTEKKNDRLSELPDEILNTITCKLNIKDAVKTSILSKRWRYIWINHADFKFNRLNILGLGYPLHKHWDTRFVKFVDHIMQQRLKGSNKINSFCLQFELGKCFSQSIYRWITCAVRKGVETIGLDLSSGTFGCRPISSYKQQYKLKYNFLLLKTVSENKGSLKHLRVASCNFQDQSTSEKFGSLISHELQSVNITSLQLTKLLKILPEYLQIGKKEVIEKFPNGTITKLELNGFIGNQHQVDLLEYLLENLNGLKYWLLVHLTRYTKASIVGTI
ncbi:F-box/LRR-repeat protein At3g03360-like [Impatiens glandulifera]|uniref:F-box/LRR-repeat protein At3g03360-like n=1 Tax=Impatiens glandulifera TaxID=253017 RepID=UPI001FB0AB39|nr:F-box/LRR-repeat protein At3g03360-like [Impatiens glandulifera]